MRCRPNPELSRSPRLFTRHRFEQTHILENILVFKSQEARGVRYLIWFNSMFEFCQKMVHSIFDSILLHPRFNSKYYSIKKNSADSNQKIIQFNSQRIIDTSRIGKVPKNCPKSVQSRPKRGVFIKNGKYQFKIWLIHSFYDEIQFKGLFNIIFFQECSIQKIIQ